MAHMEGRRETYRVLIEKPEGKRPLGRVSVDGRIILKWIFKKLFGNEVEFIDLFGEWY